ncbi:MAG: NAD-dependent epimerase/dehydratase family protein [Ruegeria sp.]
MGRVLLTGASGFVGRQISKALGAAGHEVVEVRRDTPATAEGGGTVISTDDIFGESDRRYRDMLTGIGAVVHAAWYVTPGTYLSSRKNLDCLTGTVRLAQAAIEMGVKRFVGVGTCFEFDLNAAQTTPFEPIEPDAPLRPDTLYGAAKAATFLALDRAFRDTDTRFAWCRLFYLYGEGEDERRLLPYVLEALRQSEPAELTAGTQLRDFLDVSEAGARIAAVVDTDYQGSVNVCSGRPISVRDFILSQIPPNLDTSLLKFGARAMRSDEHACVVGRPGGLDFGKTQEDQNGSA